MGSIIHSGFREMFKTNFSTLKKFIMSDCSTISRFLQVRNFVIRENQLNFLNKKIIFRKFSTETPRVDASFVSGANKEVDNHKNEHEDEDHDCDDYDSTNDVVTELQENERKRQQIFEEIAEGDADILRKLKLLEFEIAVLIEQGFKVISNPSKAQWEELLINFDKPLHQRTKMLQFMGLNENRNLVKLKRKKLKLVARKDKKVEAGFHFYGLSGHTMFPLVSEKSANNLSGLRQLTAKQKILFDCSYQEFMNEICTKNVAKQIHMSLKEVTVHRYPCQLQFYNLNQNDYLGKIMPKYVPQIYNESFHCDVSAQNFLDFYPKNKLVYLTPHTPNDLIEFNKEDIYIIGAFVDKGTGVQASLAKAKREQLRVARLPIDHYLIWKQGNKSLALNNVLKILLDMYFYDDWNIAFRNISSRLKTDTFNRKSLFICDELEELE